MKITIDVTQDCINKGECEDCNRCPIALAIQSVVKPDFVVQVDQLSVELIAIFGGAVWSAPTPMDAQVFIDAFDDTETEVSLKPFSFVLDVPSEFLVH